MQSQYISLLTSLLLVVGVVDCRVDVLGTNQSRWLLASTHGALETAGPIAEGAVLADPLLLAPLLLLAHVFVTQSLKQLRISQIKHVYSVMLVDFLTLL